MFEIGVDYKTEPIPILMVRDKIDLDLKRGIFNDEVFILHFPEIFLMLLNDHQKQDSTLT